MPISEYILLAMLAAVGVALSDGNTTTTIGADAIAQPNGGASSVTQVGNRLQTKKDGGKITASGKKGHKNHKNHKRRANKNSTVKTTGY
jgi:hypothetical protein